MKSSNKCGARGKKSMMREMDNGGCKGKMMMDAGMSNMKMDMMPAKDGCCMGKMPMMDMMMHGTHKKMMKNKNMMRIVVNMDAGWGNMLYVRGEGAGMSWDHGMAMHNMGPNKWMMEVACGDCDMMMFKIMMNDTMWSDGENYMIRRGEEMTVEPSFAMAESMMMAM